MPPNGSLRAQALQGKTIACTETDYNVYRFLWISFSWRRVGTAPKLEWRGFGPSGRTAPFTAHRCPGRARLDGLAVAIVFLGSIRGNRRAAGCGVHAVALHNGLLSDGHLFQACGSSRKPGGAPAPQQEEAVEETVTLGGEVAARLSRLAGRCHQAGLERRSLQLGPGREQRSHARQKRS